MQNKFSLLKNDIMYAVGYTATLCAVVIGVSGCAITNPFQKTKPTTPDVQAPVQQKPQPAPQEVLTSELISASYDSTWNTAKQWFQTYRLPVEIADQKTGVILTKGQRYPNWKQRLTCGHTVNMEGAGPFITMTVHLTPGSETKTIATFDLEVTPTSADAAAFDSCVSNGVLEEKFFDYLQKAGNTK